MTSAHAVVMPKLGQAMAFGVLTQWLAPDGSAVRPGQALASVESDKASYELEAPAAGILRHAVAAGEEVDVGGLLATIGEVQAADSAGPIKAASSGPTARAAIPAAPTPAAGGRILASPRARSRAAELAIGLAGLSPHRPDGLIVAADVEAAAASRPAPAEGLTLSPRRRAAADRLARSWRQAPHFVQMIEVDASALVRARDLARQGRLAGGLNDILIKVAAGCLAGQPELNARFEDGRLIPLGSVGVGLAVAGPDGLAVPVVRGADRLTLDEVAAAAEDLIGAARQGRLTAAQQGGAALTLSNLGAYGVAFGTPVLNLDESVLIFVGTMEERPVGREGRIVLRPMTTLSVCYDHRVVDGLQAAQFSRSLKLALESLQGLLPDDDAAATVMADRQLAASSAGEGLAVSLRSARHAWTVDEPAAIGGRDGGPDPVTLTLGGLLSCLMVAFRLAARRRKTPIDRIEGSLTATPEGKVKAVAVRLEVWSPADAADVERLLAPAKATCLVHDMLRPDLPIAIDLVARRS